MAEKRTLKNECLIPREANAFNEDNLEQVSISRDIENNGSHSSEIEHHDHVELPAKNTSDAPVSSPTAENTIIPGGMKKTIVAETKRIIPDCSAQDISTEEKGAMNIANSIDDLQLTLDSSRMKQRGSESEIGKKTHGLDSRMKQRGSESEIENNPHVLDPDNPLMMKFQKALAELLQKQLNKLNQEVSELNCNLKIKAKEREDLGVNLFNLQEEVAHSQKQLSCYQDSLAGFEETRANLEEELQKLRKVFKEEEKSISNLQTQEDNMRLEIEILKSVEWQLKQWESDYNSELAVSQRIADKTEKQKEEMAKEKQKQDILLLKLRQAVIGLESKREQLKAQQEVKLQQQESLRRTIAEGSADLEALQSEQVRLTRIWNGVVINLQQRDRVYNNVQGDLQKAKEAFQLMISEIESYKRLSKLEMVENEKITNILERLETDYADLMKNHNKNKDLISDLEADYSYVSNMANKTEETLRSAQMDGKVLTQQSLYQQRELENLTNKKISLEMQILEKLQDQSIHDKAFQHLAHTIKNLKDSNKTQEMTFIMMENQIAKTMVEVEKTRGALMCNENLLKEATENTEKYAHELSQLEANVKQSTVMMQNKMQLIDQLSKKLDSILARSGVKEESPQEVRAKAIEMEIEEVTQQAEKKQTFWLRLQSHIVRLTEERQRQLQQLNLLYKQLHILTQRSLKIEHEVEKHSKGKKDIEHQIHELDIGLNKMTMGLHNKRGHKESLDKENLVIQFEDIGLLKDLERENVEQEEELTNVEESNLMLNQEILDLKRECLAWEKKILLASETKQLNEEDNKANGELGQMKVEIRRMDVRFSHLRKVQETLVKDLEHCIMRRESLLDEADAREKRAGGNSCSVSNRIVFERKLENLTNRKKQANLEAKNILSQVQNELPKELSQLQSSLEGIKNALQREEQAVKESRRKVEEAHLTKQQKLGMLVRLQKSVRLYTKVKEGKHRLLFRAESALDAEMCKQRTMSSDLLDLVTVLQQHFPSLQMQILRLSNILMVSNAQ